MTGPSERLVLAVDGGNSKTDLALADCEGSLLALVRGPSSSPHRLGLERSMELIGNLLEQAIAESGIVRDGRASIDIARVQLAGADQPSRE